MSSVVRRLGVYDRKWPSEPFDLAVLKGRVGPICGPSPNTKLRPVSAHEETLISPSLGYSGLRFAPANGRSAGHLRAYNRRLACIELARLAKLEKPILVGVRQQRVVAHTAGMAYVLAHLAGGRRHGEKDMAGKVDVVSTIAAFNAGRDPERLAMKYALMRATPASFLRGTCHLFYQQLPREAVLSKAPLAWISMPLT